MASAGPSSSGRAAGSGSARAPDGRSGQLDLAGDLLAQLDAVDLERDFGVGRFGALEPAGAERAAHRLFDLALRGHADLFEELPEAQVEDVFVHCSRSRSGQGFPRAGSISAFYGLSSRRDAKA